MVSQFLLCIGGRCCVVVWRVFLQETAGCTAAKSLFWFIEPVQLSCVARSSAVLKVEVAYPVDDVKQQEGGGEEDARVRVQLQ